MTKQQIMQDTIAKANVAAYKAIKVFGRQIMITCYSRKAADKWADMLSMLGCTVKPVYAGVDEVKNEHQEITYSDVFRVWGTI